MPLPHPLAGHGVAWVAVFVYELLIFILIIFRTWKTRRCLRLSLSDRKIPDIIFQDGIVLVITVM